MARFGFVGPTYQSQSLRADAQHTTNWYPEIIESGDGASVMALYPRWGQTPFTTVAGAAVRGLYEINGRCFAVGANFAEIFSDGHSVAYSFLPVDSNPVSMAANNVNQLIICTAGQLWLFPLAPGSIIYDNVSRNVSTVQLVDQGDPNVLTYDIVVENTAPWTVGTTLDIEGLTNLWWLNGIITPIVSVTGSTVAVAISRNQSAQIPTNIQSIVVSVDSSLNASATITLASPCLYAVGNTVTFAGLSKYPSLNGMSFPVQSVSGNTFTITGIPAVRATPTSSPTAGANVLPGANPQDCSPWTIPTPLFNGTPTWTSDWSNSLLASYWLYMTSAGFTIPANAAITDVSGTVSITITTPWPQNITSNTPQYWLGFLKAGNQYGSQVYSNAPSAGISQSISLKQANDGVNFTWTPADVNAGNFGMYFGWANGADSAAPPFTNRTCTVNSLAIAVSYIPTYSGIETGTVTGPVTSYGPAADTGTVTGKVASQTVNPVQVAVALGPFVCVDYVDGFFLALVADSQNVQYSGLEQGTTWNAADFFGVSQFAENVLAMLVNRREIWLWSEKHCTVYYNSGDLLNPFVPIDGAYIETGIIGTWARERLDNSVFWVSADERGNKVAMRADGYTPTRVSNHAIEQHWNTFGAMSDVLSYVIQYTGHVFWHLYFPSDNASMRYDVATKMWSDLQFYDPAVHTAHRSRCHALAFAQHFLGDTQTGTVYRTNWDLQTDNTPDKPSNPILRVRRAPHITSELEREYHQKLRLHLDCGIGPIPPLVGTAQSDVGPNLSSFNLEDSNGDGWGFWVNDDGSLGRKFLGPGAPAQIHLTYPFVDLKFYPYQILGYVISVDTLGNITVTPAPKPIINYVKRLLIPTQPSGLQSSLSVQYGQLVIDPPVVPAREPQVMLRWSDDGGNTWSNIYAKDVGMAGEFSKRVEWRRLGLSRDRVYELSTIDHINIVDAYLFSTPRYQPTERLPRQMQKMA